MIRQRLPGEAQLGALHYELMKETASALHKAGDKLEKAIVAYEAKASPNLAKPVKDALLAEIRHCCYDLLLQRECSGFVVGNQEWVRQNYRIPDEVWHQLGCA